MKHRSIVCGLAVLLLTNSLTGCGTRDLTGYRLAKEHGGYDAKEAADSHATSAEAEPANTESELAVQSLDDPAALPASALMPVNVVSDVKAFMSISANYDGSKGDKPQQALSSDSTTAKATADATDPKPTQIELLIKEKTFKAESKTGALRVSFDDLDLLKVLNMEPVVPNAEELMPDWLKGLDGKRVRLRGYMFPTFEAEGIERFVLARDSQLCCFGPNAKVYDLIQVDLKQGLTTNYIPPTRAFDVVGTFHIKLLEEEGKPYGLYLIDQANVIDR